MRLRTWHVLLAGITAGALLWTGWAIPAAAIDLYGIKVTPSLAYTGQYDDNVFRTSSDTRGDYANIITPGLAVEATPGKHILRASYHADIYRWVDHDNLNTVRHFADFNGIFNFNRVQLRLKEDFKHTDDFPSTELTSRIKRNENFLTGGFDYDFVRRWGIGFDMTWGNIDYLESGFEFLSRNSYTYATNVYYRLTAKTRVFAEHNFVREIFFTDKTKDNNRQRGLVGVRGDITERFNVTGKAGWEWVDFHSNTQSAQNNFFSSIEANYTPVERLAIALLVSSSAEISAFTDNAIYDAYNATLSVSYAFTPKITFIPHGFFGVDNYKVAVLNDGVSEKRLDYLYGGGLGVRYQIQKWLRFDLGYDFSRRDSNFSTFNYDDNLISFTISLSM